MAPERFREAPCTSSLESGGKAANDCSWRQCLQAVGLAPPYEMANPVSTEPASEADQKADQRRRITVTTLPKTTASRPSMGS